MASPPAKVRLRPRGGSRPIDGASCGGGPSAAQETCFLVSQSSSPPSGRQKRRWRRAATRQSLRQSGQSALMSTIRSPCSRRCAVAEAASPKHPVVLSSFRAARRSVTPDTLDAHRQRETKWTTDAELALLVELWGRMARREARAVEFVFKKRVKGQIVEVTFTAKSVKTSGALRAATRSRGRTRWRSGES